MDVGLDTGPMLLREALPIGPGTTTGQLHDELAALGARLIVRALNENLPPNPQPEAGVTYAAKLGREDGRIDWAQDAADIERRVRAFDPWPGTFTTLAGVTLKILGARAVAGTGIAGTVLDETPTVACGGGALRLTRVQAPGRAVLDAAAFLRGHPVPRGTVLGA
jgi:methionyl-tRNA formyltransferase